MTGRFVAHYDPRLALQRCQRGQALHVDIGVKTAEFMQKHVSGRISSANIVGIGAIEFEEVVIVLLDEVEQHPVCPENPPPRWIESDPARRIVGELIGDAIILPSLMNKPGDHSDQQCWALAVGAPISGAG